MIDQLEYLTPPLYFLLLHEAATVQIFYSAQSFTVSLVCFYDAFPADSIVFAFSFSSLVGSIFHLTRKIVSEMTYNVSMGTLNPTIPYYTILQFGFSCLKFYCHHRFIRHCINKYIYII